MSLGASLEREGEKLLDCVHCGFCLPACPTYTRLGDENDSPRGRLHLMRAVVEGRLDPASDAFQTHIDRCLGCRACEPVCPSGVAYGHLLERAREVAAGARRPGFLTRAVPAVMGRDRLRGPFLLAARLLRATGLPGLLARILPSRGRWGALRLGMGMLAASKRAGSRGRRKEETPRSGGEGRGDASSAPPRAGVAEEGPTVGLLEGCVQRGLFARVNRAGARVLRAHGFRVVPVPSQGCCGALHAHAGDLAGARGLARRNMAAFGAAKVEWIAVTAAGCGAAMKEYGSLLEGERGEGREAGEEVARRVRDIAEIVVEEGLGRGGSLPLRVAYDAPCHLLHAQGVAEAPLELIRAIPGVELVPLEGADECCGGAGIYGLTHGELGGRIGREKVAAIRESGADVVATGNPGCMMQIGAGLRIAGLDTDVVHPIELLDESYRRGGIYGDGTGR